MPKTIEVYAPLRGELGSRLLRLEALWSPQERGYQIAVHRETDVPVACIRSANPLAAATTARIVIRGTLGKEQDYEWDLEGD